jgi:hypothetical protein
MASFTERMIGAATLNVSTYEEVEHDRNATAQAAGVVALAAVAEAIAKTSAFGEVGMVGILVGGVATVAAGLVGWFIWAAVTLVIGTKVFDGTADMGEMLRTLGFAQAVGVLRILGIVPILGWVAMAGAGIWMLVCGVVAVRQALDFDTGKAIGTVLLGWLAMIMVTLFVGGVVVGLAMLF